MASTITTVSKIAAIAALLLALACCGASALSPTPAPETAATTPSPAGSTCFTALTNMSDCLTFVVDGSNLTKPDKGCCPELAGLVDSNPICLCELLGNADSIGIKINLNKALKLPSVCGVTTPPVTTCSVLLVISVSSSLFFCPNICALLLSSSLSLFSLPLFIFATTLLVFSFSFLPFIRVGLVDIVFGSFSLPRFVRVLFGVVLVFCHSVAEEMVRIRHCCTCDNLYRINQNLTDAQRERIKMTPFKFFVEMPEKLQISTSLLEEMLARWDDQSGGFRVRSRVVSFSPLDVCLGLGLRIVGEKVKFDDGDYSKESHTRKLFQQNIRQVKEVGMSIKEVEKLLGQYEGDDCVDDFCRIYILIGFAEFLLPRTRQCIDEEWLTLVDHLDSVDDYAWGNAVYANLHACFCRAASRVREAKNTSQVHILGCAALLQMWACEHLSLYHTRDDGPFDLIPRVRNALTICLTKKEIEEAFKKNLVIEDLAPTASEMNVAAIKEAVEEAKDGFRHYAETSYDMDGILIEHSELKKENAKLRETVDQLKSRVFYLEKELRSIKQHIGQPNRNVTPPRPQSPSDSCNGDHPTMQPVNEAAIVIWSPTPSRVERTSEEALVNIKGKTEKLISEGNVSPSPEVQPVMETPIPPPVPLAADVVWVDQDVTSVEPVTGIPIATPVASTTEVHRVIDTGMPKPVQLAADAVGVEKEVILEGDEHPEPRSTIVTRLRDMPRRREPSVITKTPFTTGKAYGRKRKR